MAVATIRKRDGRSVPFEKEKITDAIAKAFSASGAMQRRSVAEDITNKVVEKLDAVEGEPTVEGIQDLVEECLIDGGFVRTAKSYTFVQSAV